MSLTSESLPRSEAANLVAIAQNPVPDGAVTAWIKTNDGIRLRVARWNAPFGSRGTVALVTGFSEFIEKYFEVIGELRDRQFDVVAMDWRGHGLSDRMLEDRRKGHVDDFSLYQNDLAALEKYVLAPFCPRPWFALGHSMGGANLLAQAHAGASPFERIILSAPMIDLVGLNIRGARAVLEGLDLIGLGGLVIPGGSKTPAALRAFGANRTTSDTQRFARTGAILRHAPLLAIGDPTIAWAHGAARLIRAFSDIDYPRQITKPVLVMGAGDDRVVPLTATELFAGRLKAGRLITIPYARHEILMDRDRYRRQFWAAFDAFIPGQRDAFADRLFLAANTPRKRWRLWPFGKGVRAN